VKNTDTVLISIACDVYIYSADLYHMQHGSNNLGRLIQILECPTGDQTYCARDRAILILSEISLGILVATVPMLGPLIRRQKDRETRVDKPSNYGGDGRGRMVTFGSAPVKSHGKNSNTFSEETIPNSRAEPDCGWQLADIDAAKVNAVTPDNEIAPATNTYTGTNWYAGGTLSIHTRKTLEHDNYSGTVPLPAGLIVRKREYTVDS
jgi:hypothetical protein